MARFSKRKTGPKFGFKRKNIPGYYLGVDKLGRRTWKASKVIDKIYQREQFFQDMVPSGTVIAVNRSANAVVIGFNKGRVIVYNPVSESITHTAFGRAKTVIVRGRVSDDFFRGEKGLLERRILGTHFTVKELIERDDDPQYFNSGDKIELSKYKERARIGDVLKNEDGHGFKTVGIGRQHIVFENQETGQHGAVNVNKASKLYEVGGDSKLDVNTKTLQSVFKDKNYFSIRTGLGSHLMKAKQFNPKKFQATVSREIQVEKSDVASVKDDFVKQIESAPKVDNNRRLEILETGKKLTKFIEEAQSSGKNLLDAVAEFYREMS